LHEHELGAAWKAQVSLAACLLKWYIVIVVARNVPRRQIQSPSKVRQVPSSDNKNEMERNVVLTSFPFYLGQCPNILESIVIVLIRYEQ